MRKNSIPNPKYKLGTYFRHKDTEEVFKLIEVKFDTYILSGMTGKQYGESLLTLEYDYEMVNERP